ncbi:nuclear transport factor 2 family protein [Gordonia neofelifaecis]|uniref:SnoaL-like domain-containing protein n=1 Tax=Gordonia neofelifaecis NRRL B-59395 TaxID=644548 RepID=F1YIB1_9ACTN|nr:nuclear transport factor 2 family protein [Gordonia neofelifaecis]EGD55665.1 hypothetical protein SCNU_08128 [Gordonia neofelifaecis NRRL B-59395]
MTVGHWAISNLIAMYAERIDSGDFAGVGELFADARITSDAGSEVTGADQVRAMYERWTRRYPDDRYPDTGTPRTKHLTTNLRIEVDEAAGEGTCHSYFTVLQSTPELPLQPIITGRYRDTFRRDGDVWRFASRHMITDYLGDLSGHLMESLTEQ